MSFWNGTFTKHRDYQHHSWFEHELANGGSYGVAEKSPVKAELDPVDMTPLNEPKTYYPVRFMLHTGKSYDYFVPADKNGHYPNKEEILAELDKQATTPLPEGEERDPLLFLTEEGFSIYASIMNDPEAWNDYQ